MPFTVSAISWSITENACSSGRFGTYAKSRLLSRTITVSAARLRVSRPSSALINRARSTINGDDTIPTTIAPCFFAISATIGADPVPVPPPIPAVMNTRSAPFKASSSVPRASSAARLPISGYPPAPRPLVIDPPIKIFLSALTMLRCCLSVFNAIISAPATPMRYSLLIVLFPAPPHPITLICGIPNSSKTSSASVDSLHTCSFPAYLKASSIIDSIFIPSFYILFIFLGADYYCATPLTLQTILNRNHHIYNTMGSHNNIVLPIEAKD